MDFHMGFHKGFHMDVHLCVNMFTLWTFAKVDRTRFVRSPQAGVVGLTMNQPLVVAAIINSHYCPLLSVAIRCYPLPSVWWVFMVSSNEKP